MDLFGDVRQKHLDAAAPLAARMRPRTLDEFAGQRHFLGPGKLLRRMLEADRLSSVIFYGPPGTGKTTLARIIAGATKSHFEQVNAAAAGVKEVRAILDAAKERLGHVGRRTVLFLDEIHRFNRAQQDILLPDVENGLILLIGATTENPFFAVNSPLVSRSQIFQFAPLSEEEIGAVIRRAMADGERGFGGLNIRIDDEAIHHWATVSDGDARRALNALEVAVGSGGKSEAGSGKREVETVPGTISGSVVQEGSGFRGQGSGGKLEAGSGKREVETVPGTISDSALSTQHSALTTQETALSTHNSALSPLNPLHITLAVAEESIQRKAIVYDATGDEHYDAASALIKSMRGGDPDAAVYWIARMLEAGEDPRFIARRIAILASEDIGNADPRALMIAAAAFDVVEKIGMPEAQLALAQAAIYMAAAPKSNAAALAIWGAMSDVRDGRTLPVPKHLKDAHYPGAKRLGHGEGYQYAHDHPGGHVKQDYLGVEKTYYTPTDRGFEAEIARRLAEMRAMPTSSDD